uniref:Uncharacterized protein n=1 Tax=Rhizophora mucronata TaxID=61149 RepID=A0A2P2NJC6_RHIMU
MWHAFYFKDSLTQINFIWHSLVTCALRLSILIFHLIFLMGIWKQVSDFLSSVSS